MKARDDASREANDERFLEEMLLPLKQVEPPLESRVANRQAISTALSELNAVNLRRPWWRRSISIPVPLAAALALLMAVALFSSLRDWQERPAVRVVQTDQPTKKGTDDSRQESRGSGFPGGILGTREADASATWTYYEPLWRGSRVF